ncbi:MAG: response regulator transcription factor [Dehalococcoidia bacterium]
MSVWIDDANPIYRRGLTACLEAEGIHVAGESDRLARRIETAEATALIFDASGGRLGEVVNLQRGSEAGLVALVRDQHDPALVDAIEAGISGVLLREELSPPSLTAALRTVATGQSAVPARLLAKILESAARGKRHAAFDVGGREVAVLRQLAEGHDTGEIADTLAYSERMVKRIVHDLLVKMNCRNRAHAVALAVRHGLI